LDLSKQQLKFDKQSIIFDVINITFWKEKKLGIQVTKIETKNRGVKPKGPKVTSMIQ